MRKRNRYSKALKLLKSTQIEEKLKRLDEALPTNHTKGLYSLNAPGFDVGPKDPAKTFYPDSDGDWPSGIPGTEGELTYERPRGYWSGERNWDNLTFSNMSQDYLVDDPTGKSTAGLIAEDGTVLAGLPPGGESFILGPLVDGWTRNHVYDAFTQIGYIQKDTRQFVALGRIEGQWKVDLHGSGYAVWDGTSTGFTSYNENFTLAMMQWARQQIIDNNYVNNIPYFYSGGTPQQPLGGGNCPNCPEGSYGGHGFAPLNPADFGSGGDPTIGTEQIPPKSGDAKDAGFPWGWFNKKKKDTYDPDKKYEVGDKVIKDGEVRYFDGFGWSDTPPGDTEVEKDAQDIDALYDEWKTRYDLNYNPDGTQKTEKEKINDWARENIPGVKSIDDWLNKLPWNDPEHPVGEWVKNNEWWVEPVLGAIIGAVAAKSPYKASYKIPKTKVNQWKSSTPVKSNGKYTNLELKNADGNLVGKKYINPNTGKWETMMRPTAKSSVKDKAKWEVDQLQHTNKSFDNYQKTGVNPGLKDISPGRLADVNAPGSTAGGGTVGANWLINKGIGAAAGAAAGSIKNSTDSIEKKSNQFNFNKTKLSKTKTKDDTQIAVKGSGGSPYQEYEDPNKGKKFVPPPKDFKRPGSPPVKKAGGKGDTQIAANQGPSTPVKKYDGKFMPNPGAGRPGNVRLKPHMLPKAQQNNKGDTQIAATLGDRWKGVDKGGGKDGKNKNKKQQNKKQQNKKQPQYAHYEPKGRVITESSFTPRQRKILREIKKPIEIKEAPKKYKMNFAGKYSSQNTPDKTASAITDELVASGNARGQRWRRKDKYWQGYETTERMNIIYDRLGHGSMAWDRTIAEAQRKNGWRTRKMQEQLNIRAHEKAMLKENPDYQSPWGIEIVETTAENEKRFDKVNKIKQLVSQNKKKRDIAPEYPKDPPPEMINGWHPDLANGQQIANRYNKLDPQSAEAMPKTGNPHIDAKVEKAKNKPK